ncbi:TPR domain protein in aerotolerance operon [Vibrio astriarenae]|nr:TPR domain protein in aerotolerance operon [Vibrio sp. C7]
MGLAIITCAGPTWQREASPFGEDKAQVVFVLDVSSSMTQTDVPPTRLERAKHKITDLIELRGGGNNALIAYAGSAHIAMPMTQDSAILTPFLQAIEPQVMPVAGKSLASTLPVIESLLPLIQAAVWFCSLMVSMRMILIGLLTISTAPQTR